MERDRNLEIAEVLKCAVAWWKENGKLYYGSKYSVKKHLETPTVNCILEEHKNLALAVANYIRK